MKSALCILFLSFSIIANAQNSYSGIPNIRNFPKSEYNAGTQNWVIDQDQDGFIYFANNDGLLCFNGVEWSLTRVSASSPLRSILVDSQNTIYAGLINDFGIVRREENRASYFESLKDLVPDKYKEFDDIWRIYEVDSGIVFQCYDYLFLYNDGRIDVIEPESQFHFSFMKDKQLFIHEPGIGIFEFKDGVMINLPWWKQYSDKEVSAILDMEGNKTIIGTTYDGIYILDEGQIEKWDTPVNDYLIANRLYCAASLPGNYYAFGTILSGLVICDKDGNIIHTLNSDLGIQNNTVLSLYVDRSENLWLGLDNGIDYIETNSPLSFIGSQKIGTGYCCKVFEDNLYLGTNQGLYVTPIETSSSRSEFKLVENTAGQVWSLEVIDGQLFCGHNLGAFLVDGRSARKICDEQGAWNFISLQNNPELLIAGHYQGLVLFKKVNNNWNFYKKIEGFEESSRYLFQDSEGYLWVGHSGRGIFRIKLSEDYSSIDEVVLYNKTKGLTSDVGNILFKLNQEIFVSANTGSFEYDKDSDSFVPSERINEIFGDSGKLKTVTTDSDGAIWYIADLASGFIRQNEDMSYTRVTIPFRKLKRRYVNEFEFVYPFDKENVYFGLEDGFAHYTPLIPKSYNKEFEAFITRIELPYIDSVMYLRDNNASAAYEFPFRNNSFRFQFASPFFENELPLEFSYFLEGFSDKWSDWSGDSYKDFTTLHEGIYELRLKSKNIYGAESEPDSFFFEISPPWRRSFIAYSIYLVLIIVFLFLTIRYIMFRVRQAVLREEERHRQEIKEREDKFQREALISEKEIIKLRNEKLRDEMKFRDKELSNQTMGIINKNKFLSRVYDDLNNIQDFIVNDAARSKICVLKKHIKKEIDIKQQMKIFETYFDEANEEFFKRLKDEYPDLTSYDLRLCAFIRMNISTKEIATILNISYRGAEVGRYRLRKKMNLSREVNLSSHLASF